MIRSVVLGAGAAKPKHAVTNAELAKKVETSDEWIVQRTGIEQRYIADEGETTADLGERAARAALEDAKLTIDDIDLNFDDFESGSIPIWSGSSSTLPAVALNLSINFSTVA